MESFGAGIVCRRKQCSHFRYRTGGWRTLTKAQPPPVTMTCGTLAHQPLTYLTFISVREVDRCSRSYGSSLSCSLHGAHSAASDMSFIWDIGSCGRWPLSCGFWKSWVGMEGLTLCSLRCPESVPLGGQVFILMGCRGKVRSLLKCLKS